MTKRPEPRSAGAGTDETGRAAKAAAVLGVIFSFGALGLYGGRAAFSVFFGAAVAVANLLTMRAIIRALLDPPPEVPDGEPKTEAGASTDADGADHAEAGRRGGTAWGIFAALKIVLLFGGIWLLLTRHLVDPIGLVVGYGVLPLGICWGSLWSSLRPRR